MKNFAKTYRLSAGLIDQITTEAERLKTSDADIVRLAIRTYFTRSAHLQALQQVEQRLAERIDRQSEQQSRQLAQILSLASPA